MSLDVYLYFDVDVGHDEPDEHVVFTANVTHNLNVMASEAVAWAVAGDYGDYAVALFSDKASAQTEADRRALVGLRPGYVVIPLYRQPPCQDFSQENLTLTDAEREAVAYFAQFQWTIVKPHAATLRGLLERLGGGR